MYIFIAIMIFAAIASLIVSLTKARKSREFTEEELEEVIRLLKEVAEERKKEDAE